MNLKPRLSKKIAEKALELGAEYCDLRIESRERSRIEVKNEELKKAFSGTEEGVAIRALYKGAWGFCSSNKLSERKLPSLVENAVKLARASARKVRYKVRLAPYPALKARAVWKVKLSPAEVPLEQKYKLAAEVTKEASRVPGIHTATTSWLDETISTEFLSSEGSDIRTKLTKTLIQLNLTAKHGSKVLGYRTRVGGTGGLELFDEQDPIKRGVRASKTLVKLLSAHQAPSGNFPVVVDNELVGVFVHEALGHACEADHVTSGESILENKLGKKVASKLVTVYDNPLIKNGFGSFPYDDEGVKAQNKILIERGILKNFILSRETACRLRLEPNGGARAEGYAFRPLVRMSNTLLEAGDFSFEELIEDIKFGVYVKGTRGGQVDTAKGSFQFSAQEAYLIEHGKLTKLLRDVALSGLTLETLKSIDAVGKDAKLGEPGFCGKGQIVPVGNGGPHVRIKQAVVGGG